MTISSTTSKNQYTGNGSNTVFAYTFKIFEEGDIAVFLGDTEQTITTHYTVSGVGNDAGGNITFVTAPANGVTVTLKRAEPLLQSIDYTENDDFPAAAHEEGLDRSVIRDQTIQEKLDRALVLSEGSTVSGITFPDPTGNAEKFVRVNSAATNFEYLDIAGTGNLAVSAFAETLLDDLTATAAKVTLEVLPQTPASASAAASFEMAEDTDNGTNKLTVTAPASLSADGTITMPNATSTVATTGLTETLTNKTIATGSGNDVQQQRKFVSTTYDTSTATGTQAITGAGFTPRGYNIFMSADAGALTQKGSIGGYDGTIQYCKFQTNTAGISAITTAAVVNVVENPGVTQATAAHSSLDSDGATLSWTKTGSPTGTVRLIVEFWR